MWLVPVPRSAENHYSDINHSDSKTLYYALYMHIIPFTSIFIGTHHLCLFFPSSPHYGEIQMTVMVFYKNEFSTILIINKTMSTRTFLSLLIDSTIYYNHNSNYYGGDNYDE